MEALAIEGLVADDTLEILETESSDGELDAVTIEGDVWCAEGIVLSVSKDLEVRRNHRAQYEVRGKRYIYHAQTADGHLLFRYCTAHGLDDLHCHRPDPATGEEQREPIQLSDLPVLADVIREAAGLRGQGPA